MQMFQTYGRGAATPKVLVLFTDGASNTGESVASVMASLAEPLQSVTRYAVGIGSSLNQDELELFAVDAARAYSIDDYASLSEIAGAITQSSCNSNAAIAVDTPVVFQMPAAASRSFSTPVPTAGVTVRVTVSNASALGSADVYYSSTFTLPTKDLSDGTAIRVNSTTLAFAVGARNGSASSVLYYTLESKADLGQVQVLPSRGSARLAPCGSGCTACDLNGQSCTACGAGLEIVRGGCLQIPGTAGGGGEGGLGQIGTALLAIFSILAALAVAIFVKFKCLTPTVRPAANPPAPNIVRPPTNANLVVVAPVLPCNDVVLNLGPAEAPLA
jgi:hypothetical protein